MRVTRCETVLAHRLSNMRFPGLPTPVKHPEKVDMVVFRENTEDVYAGIEWQQGSREALDVITFLNTRRDLI